MVIAKKICKFELYQLSVPDDQSYSDNIDEEYFGCTHSIKSANNFLKEYQGKVEHKGKLVGFNWGEIKPVVKRKGRLIIRRTD